MAATKAPTRRGATKARRPQLAASKAFFDQTRPFPFTTAGETTGQILDATRRLLLRLGSGRVTMADVARESRFSRPTVYKYFPDRRTLMKAVMTEGSAACERDVLAAMDEYAHLPQQLEAAVEVYWAWQSAAKRLGFMTDEDFALVRGDVLSMEGALDNLERLLESAVLAAQNRGEVRSDVHAETVAMWLARIVMSLAQDRRLSSKKDRGAVAEVITTFVMGGLQRR
jgi:AcrR family transcriptional regulator